MTNVSKPLDDAVVQSNDESVHQHNARAERRVEMEQLRDEVRN